MTELRMRDLEDEYQSIVEELGGDEEGRRAADDYMQTSTAIYKGEVIRIGFIPKLIDKATMRHIERIQQTTYRILGKVIARYMDDPAYRELFGFSETLDRLVRMPTGYDCDIPIGRFDIFLNERTGDFKFCEFNTDGSSAMNEDRESANALARSGAFAQMASRHELLAQELFDGWVDAFIDIYSGYDLKVDDPLMAIVDFEHSAGPQEFAEFQRRFEAAGMRCTIAWMHDLEYREAGSGPEGKAAPAGLYTHDGRRIDVVYRRAVTAEVMDALEGRTGEAETVGARAMVTAFERREVCLIGAFRTQIAHCKQVFRVLRHPLTLEMLDEEEVLFVNRHIPLTAFLVPEEVDIDHIMADKDSWIIKPSDRYGSDGVYAGRDHDPARWEELVRGCIGTDHIAQRYCEQYPTPNCMPNPPEEPLEDWNNLIGYYNYAGRLGGLFNRAGRAGIIVGYAGGITVPTFLVDFDPEESPVGDVRSRRIEI